LLSFHPYPCYGVLDITSGKIEWVGYLPERTRIHSTSLTPTGTILVFQNSTDSTSWLSRSNYNSLQPLFFEKTGKPAPLPNPEARLWTSITEYDPLTNKKVWEYTANPKESLIQNSKGSAQRLPNGNTLICTTTKNAGGRVFEITPAKKEVWTYTYPKNDPDSKVPWGYYRALRLSPDISAIIQRNLKKKKAK
jgi:hypothetical protein